METSARSNAAKRIRIFCCRSKNGDHKLAGMKLVRFAFAFLGVCCLAVTVGGREVVTCKSPDGKFALRHVYSDQQPYTGDTTIIEVATRKVILPLDSNWSIEGTAVHPQLQNGELKLLWSPDSQKVAYFAENGNDLATRVFFGSGSSFNEIIA
jgi:hypothetical protein